MFDVFVQSPAAAVSLATLIGLVVGSFLNVVILRLPVMMEREWQAHCAEARGEAASQEPPLTLARPRSRCPHCGHPLRPWENLPVLGWLLLKGRCSACQAAISPRYPLVELLTGVGSGLLMAHFGPGWLALAALGFFWVMVALTFIDADTQLLPDSLTLPLLWGGLLVNLFGLFTDLTAAVVGAMAGYLVLWTVFWSFKLITGKEGMGYGDFKLLAAIGAWLGWQMLPLVILLSSLVGAVVGMALILLARHGRGVPIPFGPYLAAAGLIALLWGQPLTAAYLKLL